MRKLKNSELGRIEINEFKKTPKTPLIIILDDIRSLNNIGSIFRTSDAFLIEKIYLCGITACPPNKDIHKTALGSTESVDWEYSENIEDLVKNLQKEKIFIWSVEQADDSKKLGNLTISRNIKHALIFGNEVKGISQSVVNLSNDVIEVPQFGTKHSLNVSICSGILIWEFFKNLS
ncbi:MAG: TrmH family RNA methyltransferase [Bacteroidetes bacterium]|jgi:23S rRNA (guanosine2251-2'-O)-methyltransferase|nr:TrmH family RNA methyltransferase [Bacteroidota bacterium]MDA1018863.1 TrmH family RNA methyltransferase [Bacteroidota bacterium]|tara:strand:- start:21864 stop:22391 length:528 start_codon:yes stop_codon:yes gene_type:complete